MSWEVWDNKRNLRGMNFGEMKDFQTGKFKLLFLLLTIHKRLNRGVT